MTARIVRGAARLVGAGLLSVLFCAAPLRAQIDLAAAVLDIQGAAVATDTSLVAQLGATVTIRFTVSHVAGTAFQGGDAFNTTAGVPPAESSVFRKQTMASNSASVPCSLAGCTGQIDSGETVTFTVTSLAESVGTTTFTINTGPNLRSDVNLGNNRLDIAVEVVDRPLADLHLRIPEVRGALSYTPEDGMATFPLNRPATIVIEVANLGPDAASSVVVTGGTNPSVLALDTVTAVEGGPCEFDPNAGFFTCRPPTIAGGDTLTVEVVGRGVGVRTDTTLFSASTDHPNDPDFSNNDALLKYVVREAPPLDRITGTVYFDLDGDGVRDDPGDEPGLEGRLVYVDFDANGVYDAGTDTSNVTIADGTFVLDIPPVDEPVTVGGVLTDGWEWTVPADGFQTVGAGGGEGVDFGTWPRNGAIIGQVWEDDDGDGQVDPDEPRIAGRRIYVDLNGNGIFDAGEPFTVSDSSGLYVLPNLAAGTYVVRQVPQKGFVQTFPQDAYAVTLGANEFARGRNFANRRLGAIHGQVFLDADADSARAELETGLDGVPVVLRDTSGAVVDSTTTMTMDLDEDGIIDPVTERGLYWFENLDDGEYLIEIQTPIGFRQTAPKDKDHEVVIDESVGRTASGLDFGVTNLARVSGSALRRVLADCCSDEYHWEGLNDVIIELVDAETGEVVDVASTEGGYTDVRGRFVELGRYQFSVPPGREFFVRAVDPDRWIRTIPVMHWSITLAPGEQVRRGFRYRGRERNSISGQKLEDERPGGFFFGSRGLNGWTIRIVGLDNGVMRETVTSTMQLDGFGEPEDGAYRFDDLPEGRYLVGEVEQPGFRQTFPPTAFYTLPAIGRITGIDFGNHRVVPVSVADPGDGDSLRTALEGCNLLPPDDPPCKITVGEGGGKRTSTIIRLTRPLPPITRTAVIDGGGVTVIDGSAAGPGAHGLVVTAGYTDIRGLTITGFSGDAVHLDGPGGNRILDNVLTGNGGAGIRVASDTVNLFLGNVFPSNAGLAVDQAAAGPTPNDAGEHDGLQNYPVITAVAADTGLVVEGTLASRVNTIYTLEFFAGTECDGSGRGGADFRLGTVRVDHDSLEVDAEDRTAFTARFDTTFALQHFITATATHPRGRTSELSPCTAIAATTGFASETDAAPARFRLEANYPNPFRGTTTIRFALPEPARVRVQVFDVLGRAVATLVDETPAPGVHTVVFDSSRLPAGVYFYRLTAGDVVHTRRMVVLR